MQPATKANTGHISSSKNRIRSGVAALTATILVCALITPANAFWSSRNIDRFDPDANAPRNYDPTAVGRVGTGEGGPASTDCYWSREEVLVSGRLRWRPLQVCPYSRW